MPRRSHLQSPFVVAVLLVAGCQSIDLETLPEALPLGSDPAPAPKAVSHSFGTDIPDNLLEATEDWYGLYMQSQKIGFLHRTRGPVDQDGESVIELRDEVEIRAMVLGGERSTKIVEILKFEPTPPFRLTHAFSMTEQSGDSKTVTVERTDDGYQAEICDGVGCRPHATDIRRHTLNDALAAEIWVSTRPQPGTTLKTDSLVIGDLKTNQDEMELVAYRETFVDGISIPYVDIRFSDAHYGISGNMRLTESGRLLNGTLAGAFDIRLEPKEVATAIDLSTDLFLLQAVRVDQSLGDPGSLKKMVLELKLNSDIAEADLQIPSSGNQSWVCGTRACRLILDTVPQRSVTADEQEVAEALEATVSYPAELDAVQELAAEVVKGARSTREQVRKLSEFVAGYIVDSYTAEPLSLTDLLEDPRGDCTEHALLFITLARALDIPAREVTGLLYTEHPNQSFGGHAWAEVVLDGEWIEVDPTWDEVPPSAGHIRLGHRLGDTVAAQAALVGKEFRVVSVERAKSRR